MKGSHQSYLFSSFQKDGIEWQTAKMSVKLIVANQATGTYKLKNNRADEGLVVMRRQTWQGKKSIPGRKGEEENSKVRLLRVCSCCMESHLFLISP